MTTFTDVSNGDHGQPCDANSQPKCEEGLEEIEDRQEEGLSFGEGHFDDEDSHAFFDHSAFDLICSLLLFGHWSAFRYAEPDNLWAGFKSLFGECGLDVNPRNHYRGFLLENTSNEDGSIDTRIAGVTDQNRTADVQVECGRVVPSLFGLGCQT